MIAGADVHKKETVVFVVRSSLESGVWLRVPTNDEGLNRLLPDISGMKVVIEASTSGKAVARWLRDRGVDVDLLTADVLQTHMRRAKNDKIDARDLARIGLIGGYRTCYIPTASEEELRSIVRHIRDTREKIVDLKNQIKAIAQRNLVPEPRGNLDNAHVRARWTRLPVPPMEQRAINGKLRLLEFAQREEDDAMIEMCRLIKRDENVHRLLGIKGVDSYTATVIVSHCGDLSRFSNAKKIASYAGLVPRQHQSGGTSRNGHITKAGPNMLRHALIEAAHNVVRYPGRLKTKFDRLKARRGAGRAIVGIARTLITAIWRMNTTNTPYRELADELQRAKAWRIQTIARFHEAGERENATRLLRTNDIARAYNAAQRGRSRIVPA